MQQAFVERSCCAKARSACAWPWPCLSPLCPAGEGPDAAGASLSPVPGADNSDLRAPGAHRQSPSKSGPLGARRAPGPDLGRKLTARGGRGVAGSPFAGRRHVAGGCGGPGAGGRGPGPARWRTGLGLRALVPWRRFWTGRTCAWPTAWPPRSPGSKRWPWTSTGMQRTRTGTWTAWTRTSQV